MARHYQPRKFFRQAPNRLLKAYFDVRNVLKAIDFELLTETDITPIYEAWLALPDDARNEIDRDFQEIDALATEGGRKAILDEADWHGENLAKTFATLQSHLECSIWTFLNRPAYWAGAVRFSHADSIATSYWRKRKNLPRVAARVDGHSLRTMETAVGAYFHSTQGRGRNCRVEVYRRDELDYFFAYPEDYAQASIEWEAGEFQRRPHHPAFEVIFIYSQADGTLDTYLSGDRKAIPNLQAVFAETILGQALPDDLKDERVYNLNPLKNRNFQFRYAPGSGIERVDVKKLRLTPFGRKQRITLEADPGWDHMAVYDLLDRVTESIPRSQFNVTQVGLTVTFMPNPPSRKVRTRSFTITWPNSCSLKHDERGLIIRKMLADSGLEPQLYFEAAVAAG